MFIFFGTYESNKIRKKILSDLCMKCGNNIFTMIQRIKYFHVYMIPVFAYKQNNDLQCTSCQTLYTVESLTSKMQKDVNNHKMRIPLYYYIGLFISLILLSLIIWAVVYIISLDYSIVNDPKKGDVYIMQNRWINKYSNNSLESEKYIILQIEEMDNNKIIFLQSEKQYFSVSLALNSLPENLQLTDRSFFKKEFIIIPQLDVLKLDEESSIDYKGRDLK